jgi:hypothetical protein
MERATINQGIEGRGRKCLLAGVWCLALAVASVPGATAAKKKSAASDSFRPGSYVAKTKQETVALEFRTFQFSLNKKGRVTLLTEPVVRRDLCTSFPVFTLDGATPTKPLSGRGAFKFTSTFEGTRIDSIKGQFVSPTKVEGFAVYNFQGQSDLCTPGSEKVEFTASRPKKKKG